MIHVQKSGVINVNLFFGLSCSLWTKNMICFFLKLPFWVQHSYFRKEGEGGVMVSGLKKFTDPVSLLRFLDPLGNWPCDAMWRHVTGRHTYPGLSITTTKCCDAKSVNSVVHKHHVPTQSRTTPLHCPPVTRNPPPAAWNPDSLERRHEIDIWCRTRVTLRKDVRPNARCYSVFKMSPDPDWSPCFDKGLHENSIFTKYSAYQNPS